MATKLVRGAQLAHGRKVLQSRANLAAIDDKITALKEKKAAEKVKLQNLRKGAK